MEAVTDPVSGSSEQLAMTTCTFYLELPRSSQGDTSDSIWRITWRSFGLGFGGDIMESGSPLKRARLDQGAQDWLRSTTPDALDHAYADAMRTVSDKHYVTLEVSEREGILTRLLWIFDLEDGHNAEVPPVTFAGVKELKHGYFDFETLFPSISTSTRTLATDASQELRAAYANFCCAVSTRIQDMLVRELDSRLAPVRCGNALLLSAGSPHSHLCRLNTSVCDRGLRVDFKVSQSSLCSFADAKTVKPGDALVLAPIGLRGTFVRTVEPSNRVKGSPRVPEESVIIANVRLSAQTDARPEECWWPTSQTYVDTHDTDVSESAMRNVLMRNDRYRLQQSLEDKQISTASYIEAVARERERERRERQAALAKQQFGIGTPSSAVNTPAMPFDSMTPASGPPQTPGAMTQDHPTVASSMTASPVQTKSKAMFPAASEASMTSMRSQDEPNTSEWNQWPPQQTGFDEFGAGSGPFDLGVEDADFSFFDDLPPNIGRSMDVISPTSADMHVPPLDGFAATPSPHVMAGPSPVVPFDLLGASSTSGESPGDPTPRTPYTPFTNTIDTVQTDVAMPSPGQPYLHFPTLLDPGFGAVNFEEDDHFLPPPSLYCHKHRRHQSLAVPRLGKTQTLKQRYGAFGVPQRGKHAADCPCDLMSPDRAVLSALVTPRATPHSSLTDEGVLDEANMEASSDEESDLVVEEIVDSLPALGKTLDRLGVQGAFLLSKPVASAAPATHSFMANQKPYDRLRIEMFLSLLTDCYLYSCRPMETPRLSTTLELPLSASMLTLGSRPAVEPVKPPQIRCCRRDNVLDLDLAALAFWHKLELTPWSGRKDVFAYMLNMWDGPADAAALARCAQLVGDKYEASGFGNFKLGAQSYGSDCDGVLFWPSNLEQEGVRQSLRNLAKRIFADAHEAKRSVVFYATSGSAVQLEQIYHIHRAFLPGPGISQAMLLPGASLAELENLLLPPLGGKAHEHLAFCLALSTYERIKGITSRLRLAPEGLPEVKWAKPSISALAPAFTLGRRAVTPKFRFDWPARQLEVLDRGRLMHIAYQISEDWDWVAMATSDDGCEDRQFRPVWLGQSKETPTNRIRRLVEVLTGRFFSDLLLSSKVEWSIVFTRVGVPSVEELHALKERFISGCAKAKQSFEITLAAVQPIGQTAPTRLPEHLIDGSRARSLCLVKPEGAIGLQTGSDRWPTILTTSFATVAELEEITWSPLFDISLFLRCSTASYEPDLPDADHERRIFTSMAHLTSAWRARSAASCYAMMPWHLHILSLFCKETVHFVQTSPSSMFAPTTS